MVISPKFSFRLSAQMVKVTNQRFVHKRLTHTKRPAVHVKINAHAPNKPTNQIICKRVRDMKTLPCNESRNHLAVGN